QLVAGADDLLEVLDEPPIRRPCEGELGRLRPFLGRRHEDEQERDHEHHEGDDQCRPVQPPAAEGADAHHRSTSWLLKYRIMGNTISVTAMNSRTFPAVASP